MNRFPLVAWSFFTTIIIWAKSKLRKSVQPSDNLTLRVQLMLKLARQEADRLRQNYLGTEHILLGLLKLNYGVGINALLNCGVDLVELRTGMESRCIKGNASWRASIPATPQVIKILRKANDEAMNLGNTYLGTEHIVLALASARPGLAGKAFSQLDLSIDRLRAAVQSLQKGSIEHLRVQLLRCILTRN